MLVKIEGKVYNPKDTAITVVLDPMDKLMVAAMKPTENINCWHPDNFTPEQVKEALSFPKLDQTPK